MTLKEAMKKYGIPVPENIEAYDPTEYPEFHKMYLSSLFETFGVSAQNNEVGGHKKIAVVLGGQIGAGKSSLVAHTKREFDEQGRNIVLVDDDAYRQYFPNRDGILTDCPEYYARITGLATGKITPKIMQYASENGHCFIFDGTMKNPRILKTMQTWDDDYEIRVKVMATSRLRSLVSATMRNAIFRTFANDCRYVSVETHDETYYGIPETLRTLEELGIASSIKVFIRGKDPTSPVEKYSSEQTPKESAADVLERLRKEDETKYLQNDAAEEIAELKRLAEQLSETEKKEIDRIVKIVESEMEKSEVDR